MKRNRLTAIVVLCASGWFSHATTAQQFGELTIKFSKNGKTERVVPQTVPEIKVVTPRKGKPYLYVGWREDHGAYTAPDHTSNVVIFNAMQFDLSDAGVGLLLTRGRVNLHYASKCSPHKMPKCDAVSNGVRHDPAAKKIFLKDVVFNRVSMDNTDPKDVLMVNGTLSYK
jgi:hypothetical protein